jgi:hypothetical protein
MLIILLFLAFTIDPGAVHTGSRLSRGTFRTRHMIDDITEAKGKPTCAHAVHVWQNLLA